MDLVNFAQTYDSSLKALFEGHAAEVIAHLLPGAEFISELNDEGLASLLPADLVYLLDLRDAVVVVQIEMEAISDRVLPYHRLESYAMLLKKYRKPLISIVMYPFRTNLPGQLLRVKIGDEEKLACHFHVIALWMLQARYFLEERVIGMYPLIPTMQGATYEVLVQVLTELKKRYNGEPGKLDNCLLWFDTFLRQTDTVSQEDKRRVKAYMDQLPWVNHQVLTRPWHGESL
jgi:hypothetical protein